jgi:hypothetical protein
MSKPIKVKGPKVEVVKIRTGDKQIKTKDKPTAAPEKEPKVSTKLAKPVPATKKILTKEEKQHLESLFKLVQMNREAVHGKVLYTAYDTGLRSHAKVEIKCLGGTHIAIDVSSPRFHAGLLTNNVTDLRGLEKALRKARRYIEASRKINDITQG